MMLILGRDGSREAASIGPLGLRVLFSKSTGDRCPSALAAALAVVEDFDVVEDLGAKFGLRRPRAAVDELLLERREEALCDGVIEAIPLAAHRLHDPGFARLR